MVQLTPLATVSNSRTSERGVPTLKAQKLKTLDMELGAQLKRRAFTGSHPA
jgi:hypothetical protein